MLFGEALSTLESLSQELRDLKKKRQLDEFSQFEERVNEVCQNYCSSFSRIYQSSNQGIRDFKDLGRKEKNLWVQEFFAYVLIKNYFKYCLKEFIYRLVGIGLKLASFRSKITKQKKFIAQFCEKWLDHKMHPEIFQRLTSETDERNVDKTTDFLSIVDKKYLKVIEKTLAQEPGEVKDKMSKFFELYQMKLKLAHNLSEFAVPCKVINLGVVKDCFIVVDVAHP